jgi:hypothetical protein
MDVIVLGRTVIGTVAECDGFRYYLTDCCGASAKGMENYVGCRGCYRPIDDGIGGLPEWDDFIETYGDGLPYDQWKASRKR